MGSHYAFHEIRSFGLHHIADQKSEYAGVSGIKWRAPPPPPLAWDAGRAAQPVLWGKTGVGNQWSLWIWFPGHFIRRCEKLPLMIYSTKMIAARNFRSAMMMLLQFWNFLVYSISVCIWNSNQNEPNQVEKILERVREEVSLWSSRLNTIALPIALHIILRVVIGRRVITAINGQKCYLPMPFSKFEEKGHFWSAGPVLEFLEAILGAGRQPVNQLNCLSKFVPWPQIDALLETYRYRWITKKGPKGPFFYNVCVWFFYAEFIHTCADSCDFLKFIIARLIFWQFACFDILQHQWFKFHACVSVCNICIPSSNRH